MRHKKLVLTLIILLIIMLILLVICVINLNNQPLQDNNILPEMEDEGIPEVKIDTRLQRVSNRNDFYAVKTALTKFYTIYEMIYEARNDNYIIDDEAKASIEEEQKENAALIYNMLDTKYIEFKGITKDNLLSKLEKRSSSTIDIDNMYVSQKTQTMSIYIVQGTSREMKSGKTTTFQVMVKIDFRNRTFTIFLQDYITANYKNLTIGNELQIETAETIEKNTNNMYDYTNITDEAYVKDLFNGYKQKLIYNPELAYQKLDEQYKSKKFETAEKFKQYAENNIRRSVMTEIKEYQKQKTNEYTEYICIDQNGRYYIFRENGVMNYSVILDTYTIDLPEFVKKYEAAGETQKVGLNIQRFFDAINDGDYQYAYHKLDNTFRANNFKTEEAFEQYVKDNFFSNNEIKHNNCQKNGNLYMYDISIIDETNANQKKVDKKVIMQLKDGTDFVMSFNVR